MPNEQLPIDYGFDPSTGQPLSLPVDSEPNPIAAKLLGIGQERYQLWPERMVRSAVTLPGDVASGQLPILDPQTGHTSEKVIERAQDLAGMAGGGLLLEKPGVATLGSGAVRQAPKAAEIAPAFYSGLEKAVETAKPTIATADQWLGYLKNQPGVKSEELATVLKELPSGPITKEVLGDIVKTNKVELGEVNKGEALVQHIEDKIKRGEKLTQADKDIMDSSATKFSQYQLPGGENYKEMLLTLPNEVEKFRTTQITNDARIKELRQEMHGTSGTNEIRSEISKLQNENQGLQKQIREAPIFKSSHWDEPNVLAHIRMNDRQLPKEFTPAEQEALKLHEEAQPKLAANREAQGNVGKEISAASKPLEAKRRAAILAENKAGKISNAEAQRQIEDYTVPKELKPLQDKLEALRKEETDLRNSLPQKPEQQTSKTLHLEEIQSDWHQKGRKEGYKLDPKEKARLDTNAETVDNKLTAANAEDIMGNPDLDVGLKQAVERKILSQKEADDYKYLVKNENGTVPDAPFKKNWDELALKKMIHKAATEGYEGISWTPGEAQAARYDLSKQIDKIHYNKKTNMLAAYDKNGGTAINKKVTPEELPDIIGKETSEKLLTKGNKLTEDSVELQNADLKIGGEGMKSFYDKMLVDKANALAKKYGSKVEQKEISKGWDAVDANGKNVAGWDANTPKQAMLDWIKSMGGKYKLVEAKQPIHHLPLTPELKKKALSDGFPLFSSSPIITPVDHDPFEKKKFKLVPVQGNPFQ